MSVPSPLSKPEVAPTDSSPMDWTPSKLAQGGHGSDASSNGGLWAVSDSDSQGRPFDIPDQVAENLDKKGLQADEYGVVRWQRDTDKHPKRWPVSRKVYDSLVICLMEFFMTVVSNSGSTIAPVARSELGLSPATAQALFTTTYLMGQAIGGLILPPFAETHGGRMIYTGCAVAFSIFSVVMGARPEGPIIGVFRILTGFLSAMPATVACGSMENMWDTTARIWTVHLWVISAVLGLAVAPALTTAITESSLGWHWTFYIDAIVVGVIAILCCFMKESRQSQLIRQEVKSVVNQTKFRRLSVDTTNSLPGVRTFIRENLAMPIRLFITEPIVFVTSVMGATVYGVIYLFSAALPPVYTELFGFSRLRGAEVLLAVAVGVVPTFLVRLYDISLANRQIQEKKPCEPEHKLFGFYLAAPVLMIGMWWYAATVPPLVHVSPWASIAALVPFGFAVVEFDTTLSNYLCDAYLAYSASSIASMSFLRASLSGVFPLFADQMFDNLGANNAIFVLAGVATAFCAAAAVFRMYGKKLRERSKFAEKTAAAAEEVKIVDHTAPLAVSPV